MDLSKLKGKTFEVIDDNKVVRSNIIKSATTEKINPDSKNTIIRLTFTNEEGYLFKQEDIALYLTKEGMVREYVTANGVGKNKRKVQQIIRIYNPDNLLGQ